MEKVAVMLSEGFAKRNILYYAILTQIQVPSFRKASIQDDRANLPNTCGVYSSRSTEPYFNNREPENVPRKPEDRNRRPEDRNGRPEDGNGRPEDRNGRPEDGNR